MNMSQMGRYLFLAGVVVAVAASLHKAKKDRAELGLFQRVQLRLIDDTIT